MNEQQMKTYQDESNLINQIPKHHCPYCGASELLRIIASDATGWTAKCARCEFKFLLPKFEIVKRPELKTFVGATYITFTLANSSGECVLRQMRRKSSDPWSLPMYRFSLYYHDWYGPDGAGAIASLVANSQKMYKIILTQMKKHGIEYDPWNAKIIYLGGRELEKNDES